jgi:hypothetical protein
MYDPIGKTYFGTINKTKSGYTCVSNSNGGVETAFCRNPQLTTGAFASRPWCKVLHNTTTERKAPFDDCDIPVCGE